ncbi:MAG TPA: ABC transporter ATP-binding protein [Anaerolineales bacterium]|nr:ABC transporter ATP-binding protein [Anaerolineales bacterium]
MDLAVEMRQIHKYFPSSDVNANRAVDFSARRGEVHALVGENGAGKTTLMNVLYGLIQPDRGEILVEGRPVHIGHPNEAIRLGIGMVHQHFKLVPSFSVAENIMLGMEPHTAGVLRRRDEAEAVRLLADQFGLPVDPAAKVRDLPVGMQQRVEILKTLQRQARILVLDEPTAVLTPQEARELFTVVRRLAQSGKTVIFITHKLLEVMEVADRVSVMRKGELVGTKAIQETDIRDMARMMVGREVLFQIEKPPAQLGASVLQVKNLVVVGPSGLPAILNVSFEVRAGEIYGIAGVNGNGQTELVEAITGMRPLEGGSIQLNGRDISRLSVGGRRRAGMAHIPEDRLVVGLNLGASLDENLVVSRYRLPEFSRFGFLRRGNIRQFSQDVIRDFSVAAARPGEGIATLSGGNLQKVVVGRELAGEPDLIVANQPTRGLDVGSIEFVHQTLLQARSKGAAVLLVSVELDEVMSLSDRIGVLFRGQIGGEMPAAQATEEELGILMAGGSLHAQAAPSPRARNVEAP